MASLEGKKLRNKNARNVNFRSVTEEKIAEAKKKSLEIVENLLEASVSEEQLLSFSNSISQDDYADVIEERNILFLCGYPLCPKEVKPIKQKYHISVKTNKVYDITERKCFCSNTCYKASNFLKAQLCSSPIWLKEDDTEGETIHLLSTTTNSGSVGQEVYIGWQRVNPDDIDCIPDEENELSSHNIHPPYISDDLETCASKFENLEITERCIYSLNTDTLESALVSTERSQADEEDNVSAVKCDYDSAVNEENVCCIEDLVKQCSYDIDTDEEDHNDLQSEHNLVDSLISDNKYMPIIPKANVRRAVLVEPLGNADDDVKLHPTVENTINQLEWIQNALMSWFTVETFRIILGESKYESLKSEILEKTKACPTAGEQTNGEEKLKTLKKSYVKICVKLDKEEVIELNSDSVGNEEKDYSFHEKDSEEQISESKEALEQRKVSMFYAGEMGLPEAAPSAKKKLQKKPKPPSGKGSKKSSGKLSNQTKDTEPVTASASRENNVLPVVESLSQSALRRQIVTGHLKTVYFNMLPLIGLKYCDISEDFQSLVSTFSLTSTNITFKPPDWKMIALILFRMIEKKLTTRKPWAREKCWELLEAQLISFNISLHQIDYVLSYATDESHFGKLCLRC